MGAQDVIAVVLGIAANELGALAAWFALELTERAARVQNLESSHARAREKKLRRLIKKWPGFCLKLIPALIICVYILFSLARRSGECSGSSSRIGQKNAGIRADSGRAEQLLTVVSWRRMSRLELDNLQWAIDCRVLGLRDDGSLRLLVARPRQQTPRRMRLFQPELAGQRAGWVVLGLVRAAGHRS